MSSGTRVRNLMSGRIGIVGKRVGQGRVEVKYDDDTWIYSVLDIFLEPIKGV